jgi:hypothetical protein
LVDLLTAAVVGAVFFGIGGVVSYYVFYSRGRPEKIVLSTPPPRDPSAAGEVVTVTTTQLDKSRREMRTIKVERDLLSEALMKLYEAENEGRITREEREIISKRYSDQIKDLQSKLKDVELVVEVGELEGLRNELVALFEGKIQNIEGRLEAARQRLGVAAPEIVKKEPAPKEERGAELEKVIEKRSKPEVSESEKRRKEIMDDVMGELAKLEQLDIEKKQQEA